MMQNKIRFAITGGIGSGKSTVAKIIQNIGYPVISCDNIYAELLNENFFIKDFLNEFGDILDGGGNLDRKKLSSIVFSDPAKLEKLNKITHPIIMDRAIKMCDEHDVCFCEVPLLFEGGYEKLFNGVIVVLRDIDKRVAGSLIKGLSFEDTNRRIKNQFNYSNLNNEKFYVIDNNADIAILTKTVLKNIQILEIKYHFGLT